MTEKKVNKITGWLVFIALLSHVYGYFFWKWVKGFNIYYITIYFNMMIDGLVLMMITKGDFWKFVSTIMFWLGGQFLYMELLRNPMDWNDSDIMVFVLSLINSVMINYFINKLKQHKNAA